MNVPPSQNYKIPPFHAISLKQILHILWPYLLTYLLTHSMEQSSSWEANRFSASEEIPRILWKPKVRYHIHKCPSPVLSWASSIQSTTPHPTSWRSIFNIILPSMPWSPKWSLSLRFPNQNPVHAYPLPNTCYITRPPHSSRFYHPNNWTSHSKIYIDTWVFALIMSSSQR